LFVHRSLLWCIKGGGKSEYKWSPGNPYPGNRDTLVVRTHSSGPIIAQYFPFK
jgi:hypothetical protein